MTTELDYTYLTCPDRHTGRMRYRPGFAALCEPATRRLPLFLDSAAFREYTGGAPSWSSYERYCEAIELVRPHGAMAKDVVGDQEGSRRSYERLCADSYGDVTIPVWQIMPSWVGGLSVETNARLAARDPVLRYYCDRAPLVAIGGLNQSPCRRGERHRYLAVLCRAFPDTRFWALGQANPVVVNGLGCAGLLDRVWVDGSWWIHDARAEVLAVLEDGLIKTIRLTRTGAHCCRLTPGCGPSRGRRGCRPTSRTWTPGWSCAAGSPRCSSSSLLPWSLGELAMWSLPRQLSLDVAPLEVSPSSDWCQRWRDGRPHWRHHSEGGFDPAQYEVAPVDDRTAKAYVERHHYTRSYVASRLRYGLWERRGALLGVAVLSVPVRRAVLTGPFPELEPFQESLELGRFVLADRAPANAESWFLGQLFRLAGREGIRGVVSFSDPVARRDATDRLVFPGHIGVVYQNIRIWPSWSAGDRGSGGEPIPQFSRRRPGPWCRRRRWRRRRRAHPAGAPPPPAQVGRRRR